MATTLPSPYVHLVQDEYIDIDINSSTTFLCYTISSSPHSRDFEFDMSITQPSNRGTSPSPADELFYKGKLLPLLLPPRLQMVHMLQSLPTTIASPIETNTLYGPRDISKKSWLKRLKLMRQSSVLKASRAYLKSLFGKSGCNLGESKECSEHTNSLARRIFEEEECSNYRRSFSGVIKWNSTTKSSSSSSMSSCSSSSSSSLPQVLKRSSSVNSEVESSIQGAIAYCNMSGRKSVSDVGFCSFSASRIAQGCGSKVKPGLCRG